MTKFFFINLTHFDYDVSTYCLVCFLFSFFDLGRESVARVEGRALCHQSDQLRCFVENFSCKAKKVKEEIKL